LSKQLFLDVETTDLNPILGNIKELGYIYRLNGKIKKRKLYKGTERKIYTSFLSDLDSMVDRYDVNDKLHLIGYNVRFDEDWLRSMFGRNRNDFYGSYMFNPSIDVMQMAGFYFMNKRKRPENFKLITLLEFFKIPFDANKLHSALYDAEKTKILFDILKNKI
jgi:DNA polymerase III epsilon subunit-like protein